jgi:hypothetical protein
MRTVTLREPSGPEEDFVREDVAPQIGAKQGQLAAQDRFASVKDARRVDAVPTLAAHESEPHP